MTDAEKVIERARRVLADFEDRSGAVEALHAQGLLASDLHVRALTACEDIINERDGKPSASYPVDRAARIGRESLARKEVRKPRERWTVVQREGCPRVFDVTGLGINGAPHWHGPFTESQARSVAAALNAEEAKP